MSTENVVSQYFFWNIGGETPFRLYLQGIFRKNSSKMANADKQLLPERLITKARKNENTEKDDMNFVISSFRVGVMKIMQPNARFHQKRK